MLMCPLLSVIDITNERSKTVIIKFFKKIFLFLICILFQLIFELLIVRHLLHLYFSHLRIKFKPYNTKFRALR